MCGIIGAYCSRPDVCATILLAGLKYMQNRGYDSAGICSIVDGSRILHKYASTTDHTAIDLLGEKMYSHSDACIGFGHTRWATHGAKTDANSHPHTSSDGKFSLVHNGILENYKPLKRMLITKGFTFESETDTEVICNLISHMYNTFHIDGSTDNKTDDDVRLAIGMAQESMTGSWGLVIHCTDFPATLFCVRHGSPILIGRTETDVLISSEQAGFGNRVKTYFILKPKDVCIIDTCPDTGLVRINTTHTYTNAMTDATRQIVHDSPAPHAHWTIREIHEQVDAAANAISLGGRVLSASEVRLGGLDNYKNVICGADNLILLGCGTSYHSGFIAMTYFKEIGDMNCVLLFDGAEFTHADIPKRGKTVAIFISQSGETKDLHRCINIAKERDIFTIGVVNVVDSLIAREVDCGVYLNAGTEVAVASTKAFTSQIIVLSLISVWIAQNKDLYLSKRMRYIEDLHNLGKDIGDSVNISSSIVDADMLTIFENEPSCFLLGKGVGEGAAREGALKLKEITYIHTEGYSSSALKHGPFALLHPGFPVILFAPDDAHFAKNQNAFQEMVSRGAEVIVIRNVNADMVSESGEEGEDGDTLSVFSESVREIIVPRNPTFQAIINIIPVQIMAYRLSVHRGINPDTPKNLAKVVTVE